MILVFVLYCNLLSLCWVEYILEYIYERIDWLVYVVGLVYVGRYEVCVGGIGVDGSYW